MSELRFLHCADLHIGASESFLAEKSAERRYETLAVFDKIIDAAREKDVALLLIAGDLFDSNDVESVFVSRVFDGFRRIPDIKIVYAAGNHDPLCGNSPFIKNELPHNVYVLKTSDDFVEFCDLNARVYGKSFGEVYCKGEERFGFCGESGMFNLMCIHGELKNDLGSDYNSITAKFIAESKMDYIALGHIHKRTDIGEIAGVKYAYCGCAEGQGFDETGSKGVYFGTLGEAGLKLEFLPLSKRIHIIEKVDVSGCERSFDAANIILNRLEEKYENYADNLYKIVLAGEIEEEAELNLTEIKTLIEGKVYFAKLKDTTEIKLDLEMIAKENSLKGIFVKKMIEKTNAAQTDEEKEQFKYALKLGLEAFRAEVTFDED